MKAIKTGLLGILLLMISVVSFANTPVATIPFEVYNGSIILKIKINNNQKTLRLLFDTGADGMAVGKSLADSLGLKVSRINTASVVGGHINIDISEGNTVHFENKFEFKNQSIAIFPKLEKGRYDGLIGNIITRHYIVKIDFNKYEMSLYNFDNNYSYEKGGTIVPITSPNGLFIIPGTVEIVKGKSYKGNFVFDTGAGYSLICFRPFVRENKLLISGFKSDYHASTISMGMSTPTFNGKSHSFSFSNTPAISNMPITLMAGGGQSEEWKPGFDGSIGMGILNRYNFTINKSKNEIYLTPNHSYNYPQQFVLGSYLFGFSLKGELEIQSIVKAVRDGETPLANGTIIKSINGIESSKLLKSSTILQSLISNKDLQKEITYINNMGTQKAIL